MNDKQLNETGLIFAADKLEKILSKKDGDPRMKELAGEMFDIIAKVIAKCRQLPDGKDISLEEFAALNDELNNVALKVQAYSAEHGVDFFAEVEKEAEKISQDRKGG